MNLLFEQINVFQIGAKYTPALSKKSNLEIYPVKIFLDMVKIERYLMTYLDGKMITKMKYVVRVSTQILFFSKGWTLISSW